MDSGMHFFDFQVRPDCLTKTLKTRTFPRLAVITDAGVSLYHGSWPLTAAYPLNAVGYPTGYTQKCAALQGFTDFPVPTHNDFSIIDEGQKKM